MTEREIINKYLGIPYVHEGRTLEGLDCWGVAVLIYRDLGYELWDMLGLPDDWHVKGGNHFIDNYWREWEQVEEPRLFDGVLFVNHKGVSNHGGLMLSGNRFIHCARKVGVVVSSLDEACWQKRFNGFYRFKEMQ